MSWNRCVATEEKLIISEGIFQRAEKNRNEKADQIAENIIKLSAKLDNIHRNETFESSKTANANMTRLARRNRDSTGLRRTSFVHEDSLLTAPNTSCEDYSSSKYSSPREERVQRRPSLTLEERPLRRPSCEERGSTKSSSSSSQEPWILRKPSPERIVRRPSLLQETRPCFSEERLLIRQCSTQATSRKVLVSTTPAVRSRKRPFSNSSCSPVVDKEIMLLELTDSEEDTASATNAPSPMISVTSTSEARTTINSTANCHHHLDVPPRQLRILCDATTDELTGVIWDDEENIRSNLEKYVDDVDFRPAGVDRFDKKIPDLLKLPAPHVDAGIPQQELPSSSTTFPSCQLTNDQLLEKLTVGFRSVLRYFRPPEWTGDLDVMKTLTPNDLVNFPVDEFFGQYEKGLSDLVNARVAASHEEITQELNKCRNDLNRNNQLIARLLNSIHKDYNLDPVKDSNKVQELLEACVELAELSNSGNFEN